MNSKSWQKNPLSLLWTGLKFLFGFIVTIWMLFPIYWVFMASLKPRSSIMNLPPEWIFFTPTLEQYYSLFQDTHFHTYLMNSGVVGLASVGIGVIIGVPAAYSLSRLEVPAGEHINFWILSTRMIPPLSIMVPLFIFYTILGLNRSLVGLTITHFLLTLPMIIWILKGFIDKIPASLEESAMTDGCTRLQAFITIVLPLLKPSIAAASFLSFIFSWNNFILALVLTGGETRTAPLVIQSSMGYLSINWGMLGAAATVTIIPPIVLILLIRNYLIEGMIMGAIKG